MERKTIIDRFYDLKNNTRPALITYDKYFQIEKIYSWKMYVKNAQNFASDLTMFNNNKIRKNVAIQAYNCPEWFFAAMGTMYAGFFFCGIYNTNKNDQCMHIINTGECGTLIIESYKLFSECYSTDDVIGQLAASKIRIIVIDSTDAFKYPVNPLLRRMVINWSECKFDQLHDETYPQDYYRDYQSDYDRPNTVMSDLCTLIFTSGTTGNPKAVKITHKNVCTTVEGVLDKFKMKIYEERIVSYLPLSHIAAQALDLYCPVYCGAEVHFSRPDALKGTLKDILIRAEPTVFFGVPRVWEKFREGLLSVASKKYNDGISGKALGMFMGLVKGVELRYNTSDAFYKYAPLYALTPISSRVVNQIKKKLGLHKCKYFATGAAPISKEVLEYFASMGMPLQEMYGMSETCGVITVSDPVSSVKGSCGSPVKGVEIVIGKDNEILVKGDNVFKGYYNYNGPSGVDSEGYLHTGDCGKIDENGFLYITGRLKELIITAGGENIPPILIEDAVKAILKRDTQCVLIGDRKKYLTMLLFDGVTNEDDDDQYLTEDFVQNVIKEYNNKYAISNAQKIQKFKIIREALSIDNGMLTPTMKIKRSKVVEKYATVIDEMYNGGD
jgi:long-chain-fatty-acid--CoA ligase ACSBG